METYRTTLLITERDTNRIIEIYSFGDAFLFEVISSFLASDGIDGILNDEITESFRADEITFYESPSYRILAIDEMTNE